MTLNQGQILNSRYRIVKLLGQGGFGAVYKAWDLTFERTCALKENFESSPDAQRQFFREAKILANLTHPGLPRVTDYFSLPGQGQYLVMDFVEGQDLCEKLNQAGGQLPEAQALGWITQVCDALTYLHRQNPPVIHRDIKPANIKITPDDRAMLVDFGIAKTFDPLTKTTRGARAVTPGYSPPEQYGQGTTDSRSDIYSLGATLYTLLTGAEPVESVQRLIGATLIPPRQLNPNLSPGLETAILKSMQPQPTERFQDAGEFKAVVSSQLSVAGSQPTGARWQPVVTQPPPNHTLYTGSGSPSNFPLSPATLGMPLPRSARPFPWKWVGLGAGLLAGMALLAMLVSLAVKGFREQRVAQTAQTHANGITWTMVAASTHTQTPTLQATFAPTPTFTPTPSPSPLPPIYLSTPTITPTASPLQPTLTPTPLHPTFTSTPLPPTPTATTPSSPMVLIPAGNFQMGESANRGLAECQLLYEPFTSSTCEWGWFTDEEPEHTVTLDAFYLDVSEVTNGMYEACITAGPCSPPKYPTSSTRSSYFGDSRYANFPVINVDWNQAATYCSWARGRLPTEAEWEYAARGGLADRLYPWVDGFDGSLANFCDVNCPNDWSNTYFNDGFADTAPVGSYPANGYGLFDMAGNVQEWVADWYDSSYYSNSPANNPSGPATGDYRVLRGGGWYLNGDDMRSAARDRASPINSNFYIGFRCSRSP
jgi:formylglycine-generating enzyme required for sulfatase activity